jgi:polysaccharide pyruvyl transferase WcaK-like protein
VGLKSLLLGRAFGAATDAVKDALDADRLLQTAMAALIETRKAEHETRPERGWRPGAPLSLLLAGYVGSRNTGADVRVEEMIRQLRHLFGDEHLDLTVMTIDREWTRGYFKTVKQILLPQLFPKFLFDEVRRYDGVIACEGSMFKSKFASALTTMMVGALGLALAEEKLAVGYGGEAGSMDESLESLVKRYVKGALIVTRNVESQKVLERLGIATRLGTDTAWTLGDPPEALATKLLTRAGWDGQKPVLVICPIHPFAWPVRPDPFKAAAHRLTGAYADAHFRSIYFHAQGPEIDKKQQRYLGALASALRDFRREADVFPIVVGMEALDRGAVEGLVARYEERFGERLPSFVSDEHDQHEIVALLRRASMLVSSRYHAVVCSMPAGVPSVGVTMDERLRNLFVERGQPELCVECNDDHLDEKVLAGLRTLHRSPTEVRRGIEKCVAANLIRLGEMGAHLVEAVRERYPRFPLRPELGTGKDPLAHLPTLPAAQRRILEGQGLLRKSAAEATA